MKSFDFSINATDTVIRELKEAEKFIRIAIFQLHNAAIFDVLNAKLKEGLKVEIFTLPYDSINEKIQDEVILLFKALEGSGAILHFCKWNVGDPQRTSTAVGRWYLFHGKFIVTDKSAIALSANFTQDRELDAVIIIKNESLKIDEYNKKFDELLELFVDHRSGYDGTIRQKILDKGLPEAISVFKLPRVIQSSTHTQNWIMHYPKSLSPTNIPIEDKLYLTPFDCRGRDFFMSLISEASEYVYLSTESFTDTEFAEFLMKISLKGLDLRILSCKLP